MYCIFMHSTHPGCRAEDQLALLAAHQQWQDHGGRDCDAAGVFLSRKLTPAVLMRQFAGTVMLQEECDLRAAIRVHCAREGSRSCTICSRAGIPLAGSLRLARLCFTHFVGVCWSQGHFPTQEKTSQEGPVRLHHREGSLPLQLTGAGGKKRGGWFAGSG